MTAAPLIAIGASAGGPAAVARVLGDLPRQFHAAIVVVQHLDDEFAGGLASWLSTHAHWPVRIAREGDVPRAHAVLLIAGSGHIVLDEHGALRAPRHQSDTPYAPSIDMFFDSLAKNGHRTAAAVLLTGMGRDGASGLKALRNAGVFTIAQDQATSAVYGMPKAAAAIDAADAVLPLDAIAARLVQLVGVGRGRHKGKVHG